MYTLTDLIYNFYLNDTSDIMINKLYQKDKELFLYNIKQHFHLEYQREVLTRLGVWEEPNYTQEDINNIFKDYSLLFNENVNNGYLISRGITENQIHKYKLGSTHVLIDMEIMEIFHSKMLKKHNNEIYWNIVDYFYTITKSVKDLYNDIYFSTFPTFNDGNCSGIVLRSHGYIESDNKLGRNVSKFFDTHSPSYIFNLETLQKHDELILVEGVFDVLTMERFGYDNVISTSAIRLSKYHWEQLKGKKLHILYDGDKGGLYGLKHIRERYGEENIKFDILTTDYKDIDELGIKEPDNFKEIINKIIF